MPDALRLRYAYAAPEDGGSLAVVNLDLGREVLHARIESIAGFVWAGGFGWLAASGELEAPDGIRVGIYAADGQLLHPLRYRWIGMSDSRADDPSDGSPEHTTRALDLEALTARWSRGEPAAARRDDGASVWLHADGRVEARH